MALGRRAPNSRAQTLPPRWADGAALALLAAQKPAAAPSRGRIMSGATWTTERIEQLRNCVVTGLTCSQIAAEIGVTRNAVIGKIHRLGLAPARPAGGSPNACAPRARRNPRRRLLRLVGAEAPSIIADEGAEPVPIESAQPCSLLEISRDKCHWPLGDPHDAGFAFCGNDAVTGFSYCVGHARMAYRIPARRRA
jgi:GcrA cell cycle regulator